MQFLNQLNKPAELYVSDASKVIGWSFTPTTGYDGERYDIRNASGKTIAALEIIPNEVKGKVEYWAVYFTVNDLNTALETIQQHGGRIAHQTSTPVGRIAQAHDPLDALVCLREATNEAKTSDKLEWSAFKYRTFFALISIYVAVVFNWQGVWGLLFLTWFIPDLRSGQTHFVEPITRRETPIWYWLIVGSWLWMAVYSLLTIFT